MEETELLVPPLTTLTEDEQLLKDAAADFAQASIKPKLELIAYQKQDREVMLLHLNVKLKKMEILTY